MTGGFRATSAILPRRPTSSPDLLGVLSPSLCEMSPSVKTRRIRSDCENPVLKLRRTWDGPTVVAGEGLLNVLVVHRPEEVSVPLGENQGPISRQRTVEALCRAAPFAADAYVIEVSSPSGRRRYGVFAVPTWIEPSLRTSPR